MEKAIIHLEIKILQLKLLKEIFLLLMKENYLKIKILK
jgi:hypothetical protein